MMSEWAAIEQGGEPTNAWEFRMRFLECDEEYDPLYCPFCNIELIPCAMFDHEPFSMPPHFRFYENRPHINGCNGNPIENKRTGKPPKRHRIPNEMDIPVALVDRPYRISRKNPGGVIDAPSAIETKSRRVKGMSLPSPVPKTSVVGSIAKAYDRLVDRARKESREEGLFGKYRSERIKKVLSEVPLKLEDATNYYGGIINPKLFVKLGIRRIYEVDEGRCEAVDSEFVISANCPKYEAFFIVVPGVVSEGAPRSHRKLIDTLTCLADTGRGFRFFAYGRVEPKENVVFLRLEKFDHLFISLGDYEL